MRSGLLLLLTAALGLPAMAAEPFKYVGPSEVRALTANPVNHLANTYLYRKDSYMQALLYRDGPVESEIHADWADHFVVTEGEATMIVGGTMVNGRNTGPGETRGSGLTGGQEYAMVPGAVITVPAGMPHWTVVKPGGHVRAVLFKLKD